MSCFDTVYVKCPRCSRMIEFQSKSGPCRLLKFTIDLVPESIALDLDGSIEVCDCGAPIEILYSGTETFVSMERREAVIEDMDF